MRASARHAFIFGVFWRHLASRSLQRPLVGAAFEWDGMLAMPSFWACGCDIGAMPSNKTNVATITIADRTISDMVEAGMMVEINEEGPRKTPALRVTRLGRIAVRQMLAPSTVVSLANMFRADPDSADPAFAFLDILLVCTQTEDCEPLIPADFEELEDLGSRLARESARAQG